MRATSQDTPARSFAFCRPDAVPPLDGYRSGTTLTHPTYGNSIFSAMQYWVEHQGPLQHIHEPRYQPHPLSILLVEDDPHLRRSLELSLSHLGHVVLCASRAAEVRPMLQGFQVDLVISDHRLPDGTSAEVMKTIRDIAPRVPAIVMSGYMDAEMKDSARSTGYAASVSKPIDTGLLQRAACKALGRPL